MGLPPPTRAEAARTLPGPAARNVFERLPPRLRFNAAPRRLLRQALFDENDARRMELLGVSVHGLNKLWKGICERSEAEAPEFFGDVGSGDDEGRRGPERCRQVLACVRQRPEDLRPWA